MNRRQPIYYTNTVVVPGVTEEEVKELHKLFSLFDVSKTGTIDLNDLRSCLKLLNTKPNESDKS